MVLDRSIHMKWFSIVKLNIIKLCKGQLFDQAPPVFSAIIGDTQSTIMGRKKVVRIFRIDP